MEDFHLFIFIFHLFLPLLASSADKQLYIVYLNEDHDDGVQTTKEIEENHLSYLLSVKETEDDAKKSLVYSYTYINGFAALLTSQEASKLFEMEKVMSVIESHPHKYSLQTTRSWDFTGLLENLGSNSLEKDYSLLQSKYGSNVIIGMIDTGVWPESESFNDKGMDDVPTSWKGICQSGNNFNSSHCNKKIIGARYYIDGYKAYYGELNLTQDHLSPRDINGHGTHTSSIAGGRRVQNVSVLGGFARGTATGGAPLARLAVYKVCWAIPDEDGVRSVSCFDADILAAIDQAIKDGVDVLSISLGGDPEPYDKDVLAIGALHAVKRNIVVVCSAGNEGPAPGTVSNAAPWLISVAASTVDRIFLSAVVLGNGTKITGQTVTPYKLENKLYPLSYAGQVVKSNVSKTLSGQCLQGSLSPEKTKGKIIMCLLGNGTRASKSMEVKRAGGVGFILGFSEANGYGLNLEAHLLPAIAVDYKNALQILKYINSTKEPKARFLPGTTVLNAKPSPFVTGYSSRGPNTVSPNILKPDITAPGQNILAAWSEESGPTSLVEDKRVVKYNIASGTSISCPHIAGVSAILKAMHPSWSSAAIRSALMTSAGMINTEGNPITDAFGNPADPFQFGSGHVRPTKAADPGLVYDASYKDYLLFLCSSGVKNLTASFKCPKNPPSPVNLNYPSLAIPELNGTVRVVRTVTNVGSSNSVYSVSVKPPTGISVNISPSTLKFNGTAQKRSFTITVKKNSKFRGRIEKDKYLFGWYTWSDKIHNVRSPMAISVS